jgi:hypothetical protein
MSMSKKTLLDGKEFNFIIDTPFYLTFQEFGEKQFKTKLLGRKVGSFLLTDLPPDSELMKKVKDNSCNVRAVQEGKVLKFQTKALKIETFPSLLIYLKYPNQIEAFSYRRHQRYLTSIDSRLIALADQNSTAGKILEISSSGCKIQIVGNYPVEKYNEFLLSIYEKSFEPIENILVLKKHYAVEKTKLNVGFSIESFVSKKNQTTYDELVSVYAMIKNK